jgi:transcriptional regulator with XRE-family HTH domain
MKAMDSYQGMTIERRGRVGMTAEEKSARALRFKSLRVALFPTQQAFVDAAGEVEIERSYLSKFENGDNLITTGDMQDRVAKVFKISSSTLRAYLDGDLPMTEVLAERHRVPTSAPDDSHLPAALVNAIEHHPLKRHERFRGAVAAVSVLRNEAGLDRFTEQAWAELIEKTIRALEYGEFQSTRTSQDDLEKRPRGIPKRPR